MKIKVAILLTAALAVAPTIWAQASAGTGSILGVVVDPSGSVVPLAEIIVRNVATNLSRSVTSNEAGRYEVVALQPGEYEIRVTKPGFATLVRSGVTVAVGSRTTVDLELTVSSTSETVTVLANAAAVQVDKTEVSTVVNLNDMRNLPLNGRRWDAFVMTTPGATNDGAYGLITFRGISGLYNNNMIDGMDNNQAFFSEAKGRTRLAYGISSEAVQEFQVGTSNFSAQYGRAAGGIVNAVTKSGTNELHGTVFYLIRDEALNAANSVGGPALKALGLDPKPKDRRQQFGPSVGGALVKDKLFYFLSYDQQLRTFPAVVVPGSSAFLTGTGTAPGYANVVEFYKSLQGPQDRKGNQWLGLARIDYSLNSRNQFSSTINILRWDSPNGIQTAPTHRYHESANGSDGVDNETVIGRWTSTLTNRLVSEMRVQWGRDFEYQQPNAAGPYVTVTNGIDIGMPNFLPRPAYPDERRWQLSQDLSYLRGRHSVKFGYDVTRVKDKMINLYRGGGEYNYSLLNDLALDCSNPSLPLKSCNADPAAAGIVGKHYTNYYQAFDSLNLGGKTEFSTVDWALYLEDSFKPVSSLTINLGLRYDLQTMPEFTGNPALPATQKINTDRNNFGPRVGLAWDPFNRQKTVIRAGAGLYYGRTQNSTIANLMNLNGVRFLTYTFQPATAGSPVFPNVLTAIPSGSAARPDVVFASGDFANPLIYQMEFSLEQEITRNLTVTTSYLASRGQRLPVFRDTNLPTPTERTYTVCRDPQVGSSTSCANVEQTFTVPFFSGARPNAAYSFMTIADSVINSWYNGFVLQARHRFAHGFQMQASLTISKAQDNGQSLITFTSSNQPLNPLNLRQDYALSDLDQRKRFTMSAYWVPPFNLIQNRTLRAALEGFQLSGIVALYDGRPYNGTVSGSPSPAGTASGLLGVGGSTRAPFRGRNVYTGPGGATVDARLAREFRIKERARLQFIAEAFNLFNRVNVTSIVTTQYNVRGTVLFPRTDFRSVSATGTNLTRERQMQLGFRLVF